MGTMGTSFYYPIGNLLYTLFIFLKLGFLYGVCKVLPMVPTIGIFCYIGVLACPIKWIQPACYSLWGILKEMLLWTEHRNGDRKREISVGVISWSAAFYIPVAFFFIPLITKFPKTYSTSAVNIHKQPDFCHSLLSLSIMLPTLILLFSTAFCV